MKAILLFIFLSGCGLNESLVNSIGEQAKDVIDKAKSQGGQKGIQTLNDEIEDLEEKIDKKENEYRKLKNRIDDKEDELDEKEDELDKKQNELDDVEERIREIEERLKAGGLTPEEIQALKDERDRLQGEKTTLESEKQQLQDQIAGLNSDKEQLETERDQAKAERDQAKTDLEAVKQAKADLQRELERVKAERDRARRERDDAERKVGDATGRLSKAERERKCWRDTRFDFCGRSLKLKQAVLDQISGVSDCSNIHICHLESITSLDLSGSYDPASGDCDNHKAVFTEKDFKGFRDLESLDFSGTCVKGFEEYTGSAGFFNGLNDLHTIDLEDTDVEKLSADFFNGLPALQNIIVTDFVYCSNEEPPYKDKLKHPGNFYPDGGVPGYCY